MNPFRALFISLSRTPPIMMLFVIVGLAIVVTMYVMQIIGDRDRELANVIKQGELQKQQTTHVVYAGRNIEEGEFISAEALVERDVPAGRAPIDALNSINAVVGMQAAYPIPAESVISNHAIKQVALNPGFGGKIPDGMRALTFGVDTNSGVAGFIAPGSHVDILGITGSAELTKAAPVMSDVEVVAVGTTYQRAPGSTSANPAGSVTVAVTAEDCIKLVRAVNAAKLYLALRNDKDHTPIAVVDVKDLFPKRVSADIPMVAMNAPTMLPPPVMPDAPKETLSNSAPNTVPLPPPQHEIEMWSGSRKEVLSVPQG